MSKNCLVRFVQGWQPRQGKNKKKIASYRVSNPEQSKTQKKIISSFSPLSLPSHLRHPSGFGKDDEAIGCGCGGERPYYLVFSIEKLNGGELTKSE